MYIILQLQMLTTMPTNTFAKTLKLEWVCRTWRDPWTDRMALERTVPVVMLFWTRCTDQDSTVHSVVDVRLTI
jgi:hypothetical protein